MSILKNYELLRVSSRKQKILRKMENVFKCYIYDKGFVTRLSDGRSYKIIPH